MHGTPRECPSLQRYGHSVLKNGYEIIPIKPGTKRPSLDNWEKLKATPDTLERWIKSGRGDHGIGILARKTPLVDIDCHDPEIVEKMVAFTEDLLGGTLQRTGLAPKTGLVYRTDKPFPKVNSKTFIDPKNPIDSEGKALGQKLEVLGDGQQFVALAVHPDTGKPYKWLDKQGPHDTPLANLPEITRGQAEEIAAEFERLATEAGWEVKRGTALTRIASTDDGEEFDEFTSDAGQKVDLSTQELGLRRGMRCIWQC